MHTRHRRYLRTALPLLAAACAARQPLVTAPAPTRPVQFLQAELDTILADPAFENAHWGVVVQSVDNGEILYRQNARKLFMPASNMKLVTGAVALSEFGAEHRFHTRIAACGPVDSTGALSGNLLVVGGGDPTISGRFNGEDESDPLTTFRAWVDSLRVRGVSRIDGDVVGDDDLFDDVHIGPGWAWDYLDAAYAAEIGALLFNEGALGVRIAPGDSIGAPAIVSVTPPTSYVTINADVATTDDSTGVRLFASRRPFSNEVDVGGAVWSGRDSIMRYVAPHDPTLYFVTALWETLKAEGIEVTGLPVDRDAGITECDAPTPLFVHESPPLSRILQPFFKDSQNQIGEMLLRYLGVAASDSGSITTGRRVVGARLTSWGIPEDSYVYYDGSGLSRYNYLAPEAIVRLLRVMARRPDFGVFYDALPIAGVDGTIERRMRGSRAEANARAKTGSISNARSLSGYVTTRDGELLAFSIIANNFITPVRPVEYVQDLIVERLANFAR